MEANSCCVESEERAFQAKLSKVTELLSPWLGIEALARAPEVFRSSPQHYRLRTKFAVAEFPTEEGGSSSSSELGYFTVSDEGRAVRVSSCAIACEGINALMPRVLSGISASAVLRHGLKAVGFLTTLSGDGLVSLIYGRQLEEEWEAEAARQLAEPLGIQVGGR